MGEHHGVTFGLTESGLNSSDANVQASFYASTMGEFMKNGVEIFTPWSWKPGMWETLHLFSRYSKEQIVEAESEDETYVSAYPTLSTDADSMTIFLINRHTTELKDIQLYVRDFGINNQAIQLYTLSELPSTETFISHTENALKTKQIDISENYIPIQLEPLSVNALVLEAAPVSLSLPGTYQIGLEVFPNPSSGRLSIQFNLGQTSQVHVELYDSKGQKMTTISSAQYVPGTNHIEASLSEYPSGMYWITLRYDGFYESRKFIITKL